MKPQPSGREKLRSLPSMDLLLSIPELEPYFSSLGRETVKSVLSEALKVTREKIMLGEDTVPSPEAVFTLAFPELNAKKKGSLRQVVNATGVVVHTNLGRSCLAREAIDAVTSVSRSYSTLEYDLSKGRRGHRTDHVEWLIRAITGAESGLAVNNNAGAVLLMLAALCSGKEVIVSRGELVEIGGAFRIPEIMAFSGAKLVEVGATNRTHLKDYRNAITGETAAVLKVHPSNFRMEGFTSSVPREELAMLAREREILFLEDLGSGTIIDLSSFGLKGEPTVSDCIRQGVDVVTFSGDKMLGGPQIGCIAGKSEIIKKLRTFPLLRALRVDKMTLAAFEATLRLYLSERFLDIPTLSMLGEKADDLRNRALSLSAQLKETLPEASISVVEVEDAVGGGAFPAETLPGWGVTVSMEALGSAGNILALLRECTVPVIAGARENMAVLHVRTLIQGDEDIICSAFRSIAAGR